MTNPVVETCHGSIRGVEYAGIRTFRGIRYARPPTGARRFLPPEPPLPWNHVRAAEQPGPAAPQFSLPWFGWINAAGVATGQDCLSLNVWTPGLDAARRPVLVWIHGGGFLIGSGATPVYDGATLARRGDLVVVTVNYRLGALGFSHLALALSEEFRGSTNLGLRDQMAALEWVRENIERFGGDPNNVTVFGQSAGAMSVGALLGAPRARDLFHRAICQSGAADHVLDRGAASTISQAFVAALGVRRPSPTSLGRLPIARILRAQRQTMRDLVNLRSLMIFLPAVDGDLIPEQPLESVRRGEIADIPLLIGTTLDEWRLFRILEEGPFGMGEEGLLQRFEAVLPGEFANAPDPRRAANEFRRVYHTRTSRDRPGEVWCAFQTARVMHFPASRLAEAHQAAGGSAHSYLFTWRPPAVRRALGACHGLDIPFVFGSVQHPLARPLTGFTASAARLSRKMQQAWIHFARDGRPEHERLPAWDVYDSRRRATMILGRRCSLDLAPLDAERQLLERWKDGREQTTPQSALVSVKG